MSLNGWPESKLKDACEYITVGFVGPMAKHYVDEGIPFLRSQNIQPFRLNITDIKFIPGHFHQKLKKSALRPGDVAVVRTGYPGTACVIPRSLPISNCADLVVIRPLPSLDPYFVAAMFNSSWGKQTVAGNLVGVAQQHFNVGAAKEMLVRLPPLATQRKLASILSAYDDLIENNTRRIAILEEMAQAIYREWFVNFRFPGHENVKLVDSPLGKIPEGWERTTLGEVSSNFDRIRVPLSSKLRATRKGRYPYYGASGVIDSVDDYLFEGKYALVAEDGENINSRKLPIAFLAYGQFWVNNHAHILQGKAPVSTEFLLTTLTDTDVKPYVTGAAQPKINQANLNRIPVIVGDDVTHKAFDEVALPCFDERQLLIKKNDILRTTRDLLLPKLISGKLDVEDLDIDVGQPLEELEEAIA